VAVIANSCAALALALVGTFTAAATLSVVTRLVIFALTCASLPVLRRAARDVPGFHAPAGVLIAALGALFCVGLLATRRLDQVWLLGLILLAGLALRALVSRGAAAPPP
jgi:amino acid transporter